MIEVSALSKSYGSTRAVRDLSFRLEPGDVLGFLGPNGAGKSTTMRILTCYLKPDSGTANVAGYDIQRAPLEVRRCIGYLPENNPLYMDMGVVEYLRFISRMRDIPRQRRAVDIERVITICGLSPIANKDIGELSKGYRQRVGLAQALIHDPPVLVLDEPTIGLDPHQIIEIRNLIKSIGREKTVILSSHILPEVAATCDRVLIINQGQIVGSGTPAELSSMAQSGQTLYASIRGPHDEVRAALGQLAGVTDVIAQGTADGLTRYEVHAAGTGSISEEIFSLVARNGWSLAELQRKEINLEDVFLKLTMRDAS